MKVPENGWSLFPLSAAAGVVVGVVCISCWTFLSTISVHCREKSSQLSKNGLSIKVCLLMEIFSLVLDVFLMLVEAALG